MVVDLQEPDLTFYLITATLLHDNSLLKVIVYESRVDEDIVMRDYNANPCLSFPIKSGFAYRTTGFDRFVESNSFLVESQSNEFDLKKYKDLGSDLTICMQFKKKHAFFQELTRSKCVGLFKRTPSLNSRIHQLSSSPGSDSLYLDELVDQILFEEIFEGPLYHASPSVKSRMSLQKIDLAKEYIHSEFSQAINIEAIASVSCVSRFHFGRIFKDATSFSPYEYLVKVRLFNAREMLKSTTSVSHVAFQVGFNSLEHFSYAFKREFGISPTTYMRHATKVYTLGGNPN